MAQRETSEPLAEVWSIRLPLHGFHWVFGNCKLAYLKKKWLFTFDFFLKRLELTVEYSVFESWRQNCSTEMTQKENIFFLLPPTSTGVTWTLERLSNEAERPSNKADLLRGWLRWLREAVLSWVVYRHPLVVENIHSPSCIGSCHNKCAPRWCCIETVLTYTVKINSSHYNQACLAFFLSSLCVTEKHFNIFVLFGYWQPDLVWCLTHVHTHTLMHTHIHLPEKPRGGFWLWHVRWVGREKPVVWVYN